jgi:XTP/dITP diphosphohydrolase
VIGEDSGIEAAALDGRPGVQSARWAQDGVAALLAALSGERDRSVRYVSTIVAVPAAGEEIVATGTLEGVAAEEPRGSEGFGYDPIFVPEGETRTVAQLGDAWKARHSHRTRAARALAELLAIAR